MFVNMLDVLARFATLFLPGILFTLHRNSDDALLSQRHFTCLVAVEGRIGTIRNLCRFDFRF
jgi:hypothetical protein